MIPQAPDADEQLNRLADLIADRVVERLRSESAEGELVDASEIARRFNVSRDYVYAHADDLGVVRLGNSARGRLRFDPVTVRERLAHQTVQVRDELQRRDRAPVRYGSAAKLLPVRGDPL